MYIDDNSVVLTLFQARERLPNVSIPDGADLRGFGLRKYEQTTPPAYNRFISKLEISEYEDDGTVVRPVFVVVPLSYDELLVMQQELMLETTAEAQKRLDNFAKERFYDDIKSLSDYAGDSDPVFAAEGARGKELRSQYWRALINYKTAIVTGQVALPSTVEEALAGANLPELSWST